jgi:hypothetical protein
VIANRPGHYQPDELKEVLHGFYVKKDDNAIAKDVFALSPGRNQASLKAKVAKIREVLKIIVNTLTPFASRRQVNFIFKCPDEYRR